MDKTYSEVYKHFIKDSQIKLLCLGVFSCREGLVINQRIREIFKTDFNTNEDFSDINMSDNHMSDHNVFEEENFRKTTINNLLDTMQSNNRTEIRNDQPRPALTEEELENWLPERIQVFKIMPPSSTYRLIPGDILY